MCEGHGADEGVGFRCNGTVGVHVVPVLEDVPGTEDVPRQVLEEVQSPDGWLLRIGLRFEPRREFKPPSAYLLVLGLLLKELREPVRDEMPMRDGLQALIGTYASERIRTTKLVADKSAVMLWLLAGIKRCQRVINGFPARCPKVFWFHPPLP